MKEKGKQVNRDRGSEPFYNFVKKISSELKKMSAFFGVCL
jgi:hypothetical protein